jgi:hypothetical protein
MAKEGIRYLANSSNLLNDRAVERVGNSQHGFCLKNAGLRARVDRSLRCNWSWLRGSIASGRLVGHSNASPSNRFEPPWQAIREWISDDDAEPGFDLFDQRPDSGKPVEIPSKAVPSRPRFGLRPRRTPRQKKTAAKKMLGKAERGIILAKNA